MRLATLVSSGFSPAEPKRSVGTELKDKVVIRLEKRGKSSVPKLCRSILAKSFGYWGSVQYTLTPSV